MTFPIIGIIADEIVRTSFTQNADQLGIGINFIQKETTTEKIIELSKNCDFLCVDPTCVPTSSLRSIEKSGTLIYPPIKTNPPEISPPREKPCNSRRTENKTVAVSPHCA